MTKDDIIRMAREVGGYPTVATDGALLLFSESHLERFAALVYAEGHKDGLDDFEAGVLPAAIAAEREACAKVCDETNNWPIAAVIRARGQG